MRHTKAAHADKDSSTISKTLPLKPKVRAARAQAASRLSRSNEVATVVQGSKSSEDSIGVGSSKPGSKVSMHFCLHIAFSSGVELAFEICTFIRWGVLPKFLLGSEVPKQGQRFASIFFTFFFFIRC